MAAIIKRIFNVPSEQAALSIVMLYRSGLILDLIRIGKVPIPNKENKKVRLKHEEIKAEPVFSFLTILGILTIESMAATAMINK